MPPAPSVPPEQKHSPKDYATAVQKHSQKAKDSHLYPGVNYRGLSLFLNGRRGSHGRLSVVQSNKKPRDFDVAIIHDLSYERKDPSRITTFDSAMGLEALSKHPLPRDGAGQLLYLQGYPSRSWINVIGSKYRIDPELFRRHVDVVSSRHALFDLPSLPSASQNLVHLSITTLGKVCSTTARRQKAETLLQSFCNSLGERANVVGETIVRRFSAHDIQHYSIEQDVRITVHRRGEGWIAIILSDIGRGLDEGPDGPWFSSNQLASKFQDHFLPTIQFDPRLVFSDNDVEKTDPNQSAQTGPPPPQIELQGDQRIHHDGLQPPQEKLTCLQSASLLSSEHYGQYLDQSIARVDSFYALHDLFKFCSYAENQFLNCLRVKLRRDLSTLEKGQNLRELLNNFIFHRGIVRDHIEHLRSVIACINQRGSAKWPSLRHGPAQDTEEGGLSKRPTMSKDGPMPKRVLMLTQEGQNPLPQAVRDLADLLYQQQKRTADAAANLLQQDFEILIRKAEDLVQLYQEGIRDIRTKISLRESQKANSQAEATRRLTFLAFTFIPLSFTTSFFGMNFRELGNHLSIGIWFAVTVPLFLATMATYFPDKALAPFMALKKVMPLHAASFKKSSQDGISDGLNIELEDES